MKNIDNKVSNLLEIMNELREKCPWDRKQTLDSLKRLTIEETFELIEAIEKKDFDNIKEELGDLFLHIVFYSKIYLGLLAVGFTSLSIQLFPISKQATNKN